MQSVLIGLELWPGTPVVNDIFCHCIVSVIWLGTSFRSVVLVLQYFVFV